MADQGDNTLRQRKAATALTIERSAVALVLEHGLDNVTVDMICDAAGVSQRTFFNYFKTKDAAILGATPPRLDEQQVREFLASDSPDLLAEMLGLLAGLAPVDTSDGELASGRLRIIGQSPLLLQKEMERLFAVRADMEQVLYLRLRRSARDGETEKQTRDQAALTSHVLAGVLRFSVERSGRPDEKIDPADIQRMLASVLRRLVPDA